MTQKDFDDAYEKETEKLEQGGSPTKTPHDLISTVYQTDSERGIDQAQRDYNNS